MAGGVPKAGGGEAAGVGAGLPVVGRIEGDTGGDVGGRDGVREFAAQVVLETRCEAARIGVVGYVAKRAVQEAFAAQTAGISDRA